MRCHRLARRGVPLQRTHASRRRAQLSASVAARGSADRGARARACVRARVRVASVTVSLWAAVRA